MVFMRRLSKALVLLLLIFLYSTTSQGQVQDGSKLPADIRFGKATLCGKLSGDIPYFHNSKSLSLTVTNPIVADRTEYEIPISDDGSFSISVPVVGSINIGGLMSSFYLGAICLIPNEKTILDIDFNKQGEKKITLKSSAGFSGNELIAIFDTLNSIINSYSVSKGSCLESPDIFSKDIVTNLELIFKKIRSDSNISSQAKSLIINEVKLFYLNNAILEYAAMMRFRYRNQKQTDETVDSTIVFKDPDFSYYSVLKYFDLNNPGYFSSTYFYFVIESILNNPIFKISPIGEMEVSEWIRPIKERMKNLIGSDDGFFYEMLIANSYGSQLNSMNPLTERQVRNIKRYFKDVVITDVLLAENERIIAIANKNTSVDRILSKDTLRLNRQNPRMDDILKKNKDKVVIVDFWATWCAPCLEAMKEAEILKNEFQNKDVVFVYITSKSSPRKEWELKIDKIKGEQYYIEDEAEWGYILKSFNFEGIPSYLIYDKSGTLKHSQTGFMGVDKLREWISKLL